ncbi:porin [Robiginitalea aurantiaca]|uniref:Porin n=1 Tax=Robiginitalea aurantiaca TaxID=3056915 RepID=A0ABT7WB04_9FLAO|nr:porin [Robiginitalea aurantiaca]MDM9630093.1 porin [Robiginitalea aurantiaca]
MFRNLSKVFFTVLLSVPFCCIGQTGDREPNFSDSTRIQIAPYGSFRGHIAVLREQAEIQENASRIGFEFSVYKSNIRYFTGVELAINLFRSAQLFNADANTNSGFIKFDETQNLQVFSTRLGYLGADFGEYGILRIGKQWSVYYDITGYTDRFNVFGGQGSATYVASSDGGETGTGRANQALTYRNKIGPLHLGGQLQMRSISNGFLFDGFALSAQLDILQGLKAGAAYNKSYFDDFLIENTLGFGNQPEYLALGVSYNSDHLLLGAVYANHTNGDLTRSVVEEELVAVVFDAKGFELFGKFIQPKYSILAGFNGYFPDVEGLPISDDSKRLFYMIGAEYKPSRFAYLYSEYRFGTGVNSFGVTAPDVFTLGIRLDLQRSWEKIL